jgi:hypothetical protein
MGRRGEKTDKKQKNTKRGTLNPEPGTRNSEIIINDPEYSAITDYNYRQ